MEPIPTHYERLGVVERTAPNLGVIGIKVESEQLNVGDRMAVISEDSYTEFAVDSLEKNKTAVSTAKVGDLVGVKVPIKVREKTIVWKVQTIPQ